MAKAVLERSDFVRPVAVAFFFTFLGEILLFFIWGVALFPTGVLWRKFVWTMTCGIGMGMTIGALVNLIVTGRLQSYAAAWMAGAIYFGVLSFCAGLCYQIDLSVGFFGAQESPLLFILGSIIPAFLTSIAYSWFQYSQSGRAVLAHVGL